jgi:hypothetical protein
MATNELQTPPAIEIAGEIAGAVDGETAEGSTLKR